MSLITREKLSQAVELVRDCELDAWITFDRETAENGDPVLPLILEGGLTWQSALIVFANGKKIAVVGNYDADPLIASGDWDAVIGYVQGIRSDLVRVLEDNIASATPRIGMNFSEDDCKADGLSLGMYRVMQQHLSGTRFQNSIVSAAELLGQLRGVKSSEEIRRIRRAIAETDKLFAFIENVAVRGVSEREIFRQVQAKIDAAGFGYGWAREGNPIVNSGPHSMIGHGIPSDTISIEEGHIFHVDLGVIVEGYSSDIQRVWFAGTEIPADVQRCFEAVSGAILAGGAVLKPGVLGKDVDAAARGFLVDARYPEYKHAFGHQVGRVAHDGGAILGPEWDRYGSTPLTPIREGEVYTLELGVTLEGRGYLGLEEMVRVTSNGIEWLSNRQSEIRCLPGW